MIKKFIQIVFTSLLLYSIGICQNERTTDTRYGISALISQSQIDIMLPISYSSGTAFGPSFGYVYVADAGSDYRIGLTARFRTSEKKVSPFWGFRGGVIIGVREGFQQATDGTAGLLTGAEYSIDESMSVGIEAQLNATFSDSRSSRFGNPGKTNFNTASILYLTIYW